MVMSLIRSRARTVVQLVSVLVALSCTALGVSGQVGAEPVSDQQRSAESDLPARLPVFTPVANDWEPKFPFPYDHTRQFVTDADINAVREMCQWYNAQFNPLKRQVSALNDNVIRHNGDFYASGVAPHVDIVVANLDQSVHFLTPRAEALTKSFNHAGDMYFPMYQGDAFHGLWQQMSNVANGLKARQPTWFTGPSFHLMKFWGSKIHRSKVCV